MFPCRPFLVSFALAGTLLAAPLARPAAAAPATTLERNAAGDLTLRWTGASGRFYRIETSEDLSTWTPLPPGYKGTGALTADFTGWSPFWSSPELPTFARSFEEVEGDFYFGLGTDDGTTTAGSWDQTCTTGLKPDSGRILWLRRQRNH